MSRQFLGPLLAWAVAPYTGQTSADGDQENLNWEVDGEDSRINACL